MQNADLELIITLASIIGTVFVAFGCLHREMRRGVAAISVATLAAALLVVPGSATGAHVAESGGARSGEAEPSDTVIAATDSAQVGSVVPSTPAAPRLTAVAHDSVSIEWDAAEHGSVTRWVVLRRNRDADALGQFTKVAELAASHTSYTDSAVEPSTRYALPDEGRQRCRAQRKVAGVACDHISCAPADRHRATCRDGFGAAWDRAGDCDGVLDADGGRLDGSLGDGVLDVDSGRAAH